MFLQDHYQVTRHICTRNCYDTCPMLAYSRGGKIEKLTGDKSLPGATGQLCAKNQQILASVYHPRRLLRPMRQMGRGTGRWQHISWHEAMDIIAHKILELKERYHSTLPLCLNKYSGNFSLLNYAVEGMFNSLGPTTQTTGTPCFSSGLDAQRLDFGDNRTTPLSQLKKSRLIILWGVNPAWTAVHSMPFIYAARQQGAKIVVIDPVYTETARKADYYIELQPGSDAALALLLLQKLDQQHLLRYDKAKTVGDEKLLRDIRHIDGQKLLSVTGQRQDTIDFLAGLIAQNSPMHIWCGFGLQRHIQGGLTIRLIDALAWFTGNIGLPGGGINFADTGMRIFPNAIMQRRPDTRFVNINNFANSLRGLEEPPVKFLWIACRDLLRQDVGLEELQQLWQELELVVVADKFLTHTAKMADLVLPVTTEFEELNVYGGYFRHFVGLNEPAILPQGEAKSDLDIARLLTCRLNDLAPGTSTFPAQLTNEDWLDREFTPEVCRQLRIKNWRDLYEGPVLYRHDANPWPGGEFATPDGKFHCCSLPENLAQHLPTKEYPFHLITPHPQQQINSQNFPPPSQQPPPEYPLVYMSGDTARARGLQAGHTASLASPMGKITVTVCLQEDLAPDILISPQGISQKGGLNLLHSGHPTDLGPLSTAAPGLAFYDVCVNIFPQ